MLDPMPRVDPPLPPSTDYLRGLETGRAETQAAVVAALMQAADAAGDAAVAVLLRQNPDAGLLAQQIARQSVANPVRALTPAPAMAALEAERAEARKVKPLVWEESLKGRWIGAPAVKLGDLAFWVFQVHDGYMRHVIGQGRVVYRTIEAAKAAAQADYEARILSALDKP